MPGGCHGHRDTTQPQGSAPRGSAAGLEFRMRTSGDKQGSPRHTLPTGTLRPGLQDFQLTASPRETPGHRKLRSPPPTPPDLPAQKSRAVPAGQRAQGRSKASQGLADRPPRW